MAVESHDKKLDDLLKMVEDGKAQLPDFQRSWVWDDTKICKLIESITSGFTMGAAMFLANGGEQVRFSYRKFEGVTSTEEVTPEWLVLDGQQRLTTLAPALYHVLVHQSRCLTQTSFRFRVATDTLVFGCSLPVIRAAWGLAPVRVCPCWANNQVGGKH